MEEGNGIPHNFHLYQVNLTLEEHNEECHCGIRAQVYVCWTDRNPGRRFLRCGIENPEEHCNFFRWFDERFSDHIYTLLRNLKHQNNQLSSELFDLNRKWERVSGSDYLEMEEELSNLKAKLVAAEKEVYAMKNLKNVKKAKEILHISMVVAFGAALAVIMLKTI